MGLRCRQMGARLSTFRPGCDGWHMTHADRDVINCAKSLARKADAGMSVDELSTELHRLRAAVKRLEVSERKRGNRRPCAQETTACQSPIHGNRRRCETLDHVRDIPLFRP